MKEIACGLALGMAISVPMFLSVPALAADPADEMALMLVRDNFFATHSGSYSGNFGSNEDELLVDQQGLGNFSRVDQGNSLQGRVEIRQHGNQNAIGAVQFDGTGNSLHATQTGDSNYVAATQRDAGNSANLAQNGDGNRISLDQRNGGNNADVTQSGYGELVLEQDGGATANIVMDAGLPGAPVTFTLIQPAGDSVTVHVTN